MADEPPPGEARAFIDEVRRAHRDRGKKLSGRARLSERQERGIRATVTSGAVAVPDASITQDIEQRLLERFEEMARRTGDQVPDALRPDILSLLVAELWVNARILKSPPEPLVPVTVVSGAIAPELVREFPEFSEAPGLLRYAATQNPADPRALLRHVQKTAGELATDAEFASFRETPGIFREVAAHQQSNPKGALRRMQRNISALEKDAEFADLRQTPWVFRHAAVHNATNPKEGLRSVVRTAAELAGDEEFASLRERPGIFLRIAARNPGDPRTALRRIMAGGTEEDEAGKSHADQVEARRTPSHRGPREK